MAELYYSSKALSVVSLSGYRNAQSGDAALTQLQQIDAANRPLIKSRKPLVLNHA